MNIGLCVRWKQCLCLIKTSFCSQLFFFSSSYQTKKQKFYLKLDKKEQYWRARRKRACMKRWKESASAQRSDRRSDGERTPDCVPVRRRRLVWKRDTRVRRWTADVTSTGGDKVSPPCRFSTAWQEKVSSRTEMFFISNNSSTELCFSRKRNFIRHCTRPSSLFFFFFLLILCVYSKSNIYKFNLFI